MVHRKLNIPWLKIIQFHTEIARRNEEAIFALPPNDPDSDRWSSLKDFSPISFSGPWSISQETVVSQQLSQIIRGEGHTKLFIGGPCWIKWHVDNNRGKKTFTLNWQPVIYREVRVEFDPVNGFIIVPETSSWDLSPLVNNYLEQKENPVIQPN